jgi:hypothetical protein
MSQVVAPAIQRILHSAPFPHGDGTPADGGRSGDTSVPAQLGVLGIAPWELSPIAAGRSEVPLADRPNTYMPGTRFALALARHVQRHPLHPEEEGALCDRDRAGESQRRRRVHSSPRRRRSHKEADGWPCKEIHH